MLDYRNSGLTINSLVAVHSEYAIADVLRALAAFKHQDFASVAIGELKESDVIFNVESAAHLCANTIASSNELLASRFAPCNPVLAHSPQAYRFLIDVLPHSSVFIPPQL